jgi:hypothetical protein
MQSLILKGQTDGKHPKKVQLRPWPPHFKALSYPGEILVLWVATHDKQKLRGRDRTTQPLTWVLA